MSTRFRMALLIACATASLFSAPRANADLSDALDSMFVATGNEPAIYASQRRGGVDLGTLRLRSPVTSVNVFSTAPFGARAGCGGIDLYGGSFTFINTEQFRQVLRQIGSNAIGYAFKLALATMCEPCDRHLTTLQDMMNSLNQVNIDSCRWAKGLVNDAAGALGFREEEEGGQALTTAGAFDDTFGALLDDFANANTRIAEDDPTGAHPDNPNTGNLTWNALRVAQTDTLFPFLGGNLSNNEIMLNIAGSWMVRGPSDTEVAGGLFASPDYGMESLLTFAELMGGISDNADGSGDAHQLYTCAGDVDYCLNPTKTTVAWDFEGVNAWALDRLTDAANHMASDVTAGTDHDPAMINFLGSLPISVNRHMLELQGSQALYVYVDDVAPDVAQWYGVQLAKTYARTIRQAYGTGTNAPMMMPNVLRNIEAFESQYIQAERDLLDNGARRFDEIEALVERLSRLTREETSRPVTRNN